MTKANGKMNPREREIGMRLKAFREGIKFSQPAFASLIGITRDQLASIEYGRTPLKYSVAWKIREVFRVSIDWLWGGDMGPEHLNEDVNLPLPNSGKLDKNALLTTVFKRFYKLSDEDSSPGIHLTETKEIKVDKQEVSHRWFISMVLHHEIDDWVSRVPDGYTKDFTDKLRQLANIYLKALPEDSCDVIEARATALLWEKMRANVAVNLASLRGIDKKHPLTQYPNTGTIDNVKPILPKLIERLRKATEERGRKAELASWLGVSPQKITDWLSDRMKPSGEYTLQLLHWVEQQERQK